MAKNEKTKKDKRHFFKDFKAELKKVIWPTKKQLINNTTAVITIVLVLALIVITLDLVFETLNNYRINKLDEFIETRNTSEENNTVSTDESNNVEENIEVSTNESDNVIETNQDS